MKLLFSLCLLTVSLVSIGQDSTSSKAKYYSVNSFGIEIGDLHQNTNVVYLQSLHGIKFDNSFGIAGGLNLIWSDSYKFLPALISIRRSPTSKNKFGYNFDFGYNFPLAGRKQEFQTEYEFSKGGTFFHPQISGHIYDGKCSVYMNIGYRAYGFTEKYKDAFSWNGNEVEIENKITARFLTVGITVEIW
jgi:hypothetical protein